MGFCKTIEKWELIVFMDFFFLLGSYFKIFGMRGRLRIFKYWQDVRVRLAVILHVNLSITLVVMEFRQGLFGKF